MNNNFSRNIIITENQLSFIKENLSTPTTEKILLIKKFLDQNFIRAKQSTIGVNGKNVDTPIIAQIDANNNVLKNYSIQQLFELLQDKYEHLYFDTDKRDKLIKQIIIDWYNKKLSKEGLLTKLFK